MVAAAMKNQRQIELDYDARRQPTTSRYCAKCHKDIAPIAPARKIYLKGLFPRMVIHPGDLDGSEIEGIVGLDCAKQIGLKFTRPE